MSGEGKVISVNGEKAIVRIQKRSSCGHNCNECGACSNPTFDTSVENPVGAGVGDTVLIEAQSGKILWLAFIMYILPVFLLIAAVAIADVFFGKMSDTLVAAIVVIAIWFALIKILNNKNHTNHVITAILHSNSK